jgi:hypothetical protein
MAEGRSTLQMDSDSPNIMTKVRTTSDWRILQHNINFSTLVGALYLHIARVCRDEGVNLNSYQVSIKIGTHTLQQAAINLTRRFPGIHTEQNACYERSEFML